MSKDLISRYVWIIDTLNRYERLTREDISRLWERSSLSNGTPMPERSFYNYRRAIEEAFHIDIPCDRQGYYYIDRSGSRAAKSLTNWLVDTYALNLALKDSEEAYGMVEVEDVPSARGHLPSVLQAIRDCSKVKFTYAGFNRSRAEHDIIFLPYYLKRYKQRWYMIGSKEKNGEIRTYALDRIRELTVTTDTFKRPEGLDMDEIFGNIIGVTASKADVRTVRLQVTPMQAKYFRALPLHSSQIEEEICDDYSIFTYRLKLNYELVHELMGLGAAVRVLAPKELIIMVTQALRDALNQY
ncbi:MAG: WYL domain-containing protein [Muribaculaceae bacterium]|nr:WYL domain-containing protein [Muribaculaceae bacterium]